MPILCLGETLAEREHIRSLLLTVGFDSAQSDRSDEGEHTARFKVLLESSRESAAVAAAVVDRLRDRFAGIPDLEANVVRPVLFSSKTPVEVEIHGYDLRKLPMAQLFRGLALQWPESAFQELVPNV